MDPLSRLYFPITPAFSEIKADLVPKRSISRDSVIDFIHLEKEGLAKVVACDFILELSLLDDKEFIEHVGKDGYILSLLKCNECAASCLERIHPFFYHFILARYYYLRGNKEKAFTCFFASMQHQDKQSDKLENRYREELLVASYGYAALCTEDASLASQLFENFYEGVTTLFGSNRCNFPIIRDLLALLKLSTD